MENILGLAVVGAGIFACIAALHHVIKTFKDTLEVGQVIKTCKDTNGFDQVIKTFQETWEVAYVRNEEECIRAIRRILGEISTYPVLGLDCEWEPECMNTNKVDILSLATSRHYCAVIQIANFKYIPEILWNLLANRRILKVGVGIQNDQQHLPASGLILNQWVDLRHINDMLPFYPPKIQSSSNSLEGLTKKILGENLDKGMKFCGNWDKKLTEKQIDYAAKDAEAGIRICNTLLESALQGFKERGLRTLYEFSECPYP